MRIVLISDTHLAAAAVAFTRNAEVAAARVRELAPDLVIHLGDVTADGVGDPAQFSFARAVLGGLGAPLLAVPGNHDVGDCPPSGGTKEPALDLPSLEAFREAFGADYWSLRTAGWLLVGIDVQLFGSGTDEEAEQDAALSSVLDTGSEQVAVFLHKPLFLEEPEDHPSHLRYVPVEPRRRLLRALSRRDVGLVASGHVHQARVHQVGATTHLWTPSTAFLMPDAIQETIGRKVVGLAVVDLEGEARVRIDSPPDLIANDLFDHPEVYPQVTGLRNRV